MALQDTIHGRGAAENPANRFQPLHILPDPDAIPFEDEESSPRTHFLRDTSRSIIAKNNSPDIPFEVSLNPYRGCEHGCIYCYARPTHEYLGFSAGLDFETKIVVKADAPALLRQELSSPRWIPKVVAIGGVTDPYQPVERRLKLTRGCLDVFAQFGNPATLITKNHLVTRDLDLLSSMARRKLTAVFVSVTTLDRSLTRILEPRTASPERRIDAIRQLSAAKVPVGVMIAPVIPAVTDIEIPRILEAVARAGAQTAGFVPLRLPFAVKDLFAAWLARHMPDRRDKVLNRIRQMRGGKLNEAEFGARMRGEGVFAEQTRSIFEVSCRRVGLDGKGPELSTDEFRRPAGEQTLFEQLPE